MLKRLRTTLGALAVGIVNVIVHGEQPTVVLSPGDRAPDFALPGSDGATHQLSTFAGKSAVVVAWFPKAFTGG